MVVSASRVPKGGSPGRQVLSWWFTQRCEGGGGDAMGSPAGPLRGHGGGEGGGPVGRHHRGPKSMQQGDDRSRTSTSRMGAMLGLSG